MRPSAVLLLPILLIRIKGIINQLPPPQPSYTVHDKSRRAPRTVTEDGISSSESLGSSSRVKPEGAERGLAVPKLE